MENKKEIKVPAKEVVQEPQAQPNRKQRRMSLKYRGALKLKNSLQPFTQPWYEWYEQSRAHSTKIHTHNTERVQSEAEAVLLDREGKIIVMLKSQGKKKKEIDNYIACWYDGMVKPYLRDKSLKLK